MHEQRKWRVNYGVTQELLARCSAVGDIPPVDQGQISKIDRGDCYPGIKAAAQLCIASARAIVERKNAINARIAELEADEETDSDEIEAELESAHRALSQLGVAQPLRLAHYLPRELAITYSQTMEAHANGLAQGTAAEAADRGGDESKRRYAKKTAQEAVSTTHQRARTRGRSGPGRKAAKATKAKAGKR